MAEHIATILGTVLCARILADITVYLCKRHKEKEDEKRVKEYEINRLNRRLDVLEKDINVLIKERREAENDRS